MKVLILTASEKKNLELADKFYEYLKLLKASVEIVNLVELDLPLYHSRNEEKYQAQELLSAHLEDFHEARAYVFISPEYNGSTPPVFNNFLAWLSRSSKDWRESLNGKTAAIATYSGGGGFHVLSAMRTQLSFIGMNVLGRQILTHTNKPLEDKTLQSVCQELIKHAQL